MTCKICGKQLPEGSAVCKYCGAHVKSGAPAKKPQRRYSRKGLARKRMINLIITLLALLLIGGVVAGVIWSAREAGNKGKGEDQISADAQNDDEQENDVEEPEATGEEETIQQPEGSIVQQRPVDEQKPEQEDAQEEEQQEELPGTVTETTPEDGQDAEVVPEQPAVQTPSGNYTISINRTETTASLNHYRELYVYINETLPDGVEVVETTWTSSNPAVVRAEPGKAWGVSIGSATVTGTITLSDGQSLSATCKVNVVESQSQQTQTSTQTTITGDYVLADSSSRVYSAAELDALSNYQLWIARNEIYARHGRKFNNSELQTYFNGKSWYNGTIAADSFNESVLSRVEQQNVDAILAEEASRG